MFNPNNPNHRNNPNRGGFTIGEMTIVIAIMAILGTIGFRTYFAERDRFEFNNALIKTMQLVKSVRTYATTSYPIYIKSIDSNIIPLDGYGIKAELNPKTKQFTLTVFANVGNGPDLSSFQKDNDPNSMDDSDIVLETYTLPTQIAFRYFYFKEEGKVEEKKWKAKKDEEPAGPTATVATLFFKPPLGDLLISDDQSKPLEQLSLQFENPLADAVGPKKCQRVILNKVKVFPELKYEPTC